MGFLQQITPVAVKVLAVLMVAVIVLDLGITYWLYEENLIVDNCIVT